MCLNSNISYNRQICRLSPVVKYHDRVIGCEEDFDRTHFFQSPWGLSPEAPPGASVSKPLLRLIPKRLRILADLKPNRAIGEPHNLSRFSVPRFDDGGQSKSECTLGRCECQG